MSMSEILSHQATKVIYKSSDSTDRQSEPEVMNGLERTESDLVPALQLEKIDEFFQICDSEGKGYITPSDMRRLNKELPLSAEELENVFDSLDLDRNGHLTLEEFSSEFSKFLRGRRISLDEDELRSSLSQDSSEALYQNEPQDNDEEKHFSTLMESLGASNIFEDPSEVRSLWTQLRKDEPHLLYNFEEFLARVTCQIRVAQQEKSEMESALKKKAATHNGEIQKLYEEMEQQIKNEKDKLSHKDFRSQDLQQQLSSKEQELEWLFLKQRRLEQQCQNLHSEHQDSRVQNVKLKVINQELSHELEQTCHELSLAQEQLAKLQEQGFRQQQEKEMEVYKMTERLQREKQNLVNQLDLLREMNKQLRDEKDSLKCSRMVKKAVVEPGPASTVIVHSDRKQAERNEAGTEVTQRPNRKTSSCSSSPHSDSKDEGMMRSAKLTAMPEKPDPSAVDSLLFNRIISIEEDPLPDLLEGEVYPVFHQMNEDEEAAQIDLQMSPMFPLNMSLPSATRGQPVGKKPSQKGPMESSASARQHLFKVILVGNSSVGKTALMHRFCDDHFHTDTTATVGIDYSFRTLNLGDSQVALQLWDTAGQERFRSITKQFFRKADGVVVIYDITVRDSFKSVHPWLVSIQETVGDPVPIMLLGNKSDSESMRQVATVEGEKLAKEECLLFYECSAYSGYNVQEAMVHLARVLKEQEDRVWENTVRLVDQPVKKKACCM